MVSYIKVGLEQVIMVEQSGVGPGEHHAWNVKVGLDPKTLGPEHKKHQSKAGSGFTKIGRASCRERV